MARQKLNFAEFKPIKPYEEGKAFCTKIWKDGGATPIANFKSIQMKLNGVLKKGGVSPYEIPVAPWVRDAYAAENCVREKKKLPPLAWTRFCKLLVEKKTRRKMLVAGKIMDKILKSM